eukprot:14693397-Alexandrium_andersonii.AAC.1
MCSIAHAPTPLKPESPLRGRFSHVQASSGTRTPLDSAEQRVELRGWCPKQPSADCRRRPCRFCAASGIRRCMRAFETCVEVLETV